MRISTALLALLAACAAAAPARAMEDELELYSEGLPGCYPTWNDPEVRAPTIVSKESGRTNERMTRLLRASALKVARALRELELAGTKASCPGYWGGDDVHEQYLVLYSTIEAAAELPAREYAAISVSERLEWETLSLSKLEKELAGFSAAPGPFAGTCRPPAVSTEVFVPEPGQGSTAEEKAALAQLTEEARALRESELALTRAYADALVALEGRACEASGRQFYRMIEGERDAYLTHRDKVLGKLMRAKIRWKPLGK